MHFCTDELQMLLFALPIVGGLWLWFTHSIRRFFPREHRISACGHEHADVSSASVRAAHSKLGHLGESTKTCTIDRDKEKQ